MNNKNIAYELNWDNWSSIESDINITPNKIQNRDLLSPGPELFGSNTLLNATVKKNNNSNVQDFNLFSNSYDITNNLLNKSLVDQSPDKPSESPDITMLVSQIVNNPSRDDNTYKSLSNSLTNENVNKQNEYMYSQYNDYSNLTTDDNTNQSYSNRSNDSILRPEFSRYEPINSVRLEKSNMFKSVDSTNDNSPFIRSNSTYLSKEASAFQPTSTSSSTNSLNYIDYDESTNRSSNSSSYTLNKISQSPEQLIFKSLPIRSISTTNVAESFESNQKMNANSFIRHSSDQSLKAHNHRYSNVNTLDSDTAMGLSIDDTLRNYQTINPQMTYNSIKLQSRQNNQNDQYNDNYNKSINNSLYPPKPGYPLQSNSSSNRNYNRTNPFNESVKPLRYSNDNRLPTKNLKDKAVIRHSHDGIVKPHSSSNLNKSNLSHSISNLSTTSSINLSTISSFNNKNRKQDFIETPQIKSIYREFYRIFRKKEKESLESAKQYAINELNYIPESLKWRIYLELAEIAKRNNDFEEARLLYQQVVQSQPYASQGWLEWSKMEEEYGYFNESLTILIDGLNLCNNNYDSLLTKAIKQQEKKYQFNLIRSMLSNLKNEPTDKVWRGILEGALFEQRIGNYNVARLLFKYLMIQVPWYGPIYYEAYKLEEKLGKYKDCLDIIHRGLKELPRYGPLWFGLLRIYERYDYKTEIKYWINGSRPLLANYREQISNAITHISKELTWKIYFELSQVEERSGEISANGLNNTMFISVHSARYRRYSNSKLNLVKSLFDCPHNLRWRIWLAGSRLEINLNNISKARRLLTIAFLIVPIKSKVYVYLEASRLEEYVGNISLSRKLLSIACNELSNEWKLYLEAVLLETRQGNMYEAIRLAQIGLENHPGTGRLWSILIQLCHRLETIIPNKFIKHINNTNNIIEFDDIDNEITSLFNPTANSVNYNILIPNKLDIFNNAIHHVPKSGEVWCEGARCVLNPMNIISFDLNIAQKYLLYSIQFTPQYGDTFIEYIRLEICIQIFLPIVLDKLGLPIISFINQFLSNDLESDSVRMREHDELLIYLCNQPISEPSNTIDRQNRRIQIEIIETMSQDFISSEEFVDRIDSLLLDDLQRRCENADPNYGTNWFNCRLRQFDTPKAVLKSALSILKYEMLGCHRLYIRAIYHFVVKSVMSLIKSYTVKSIDITTLFQFPFNNKSVDDTTTYNETNGLNTYQSNNFINSFDNPNQINTPISGFNQSIESIDIQLSRYMTLLKDVSLCNNKLDSWRLSHAFRAKLSIVDINGNIYIATDFVTGLIELNRFMFTKNLNNEELRQLLFTFDQIIT